jgi:hypothetical protein
MAEGSGCMTITKWNPEDVKEMALSMVVKNAEAVGKFCEDDARQRLDKIQTPDTKRDKNYREFLSKYILTHTVEDEKNEVIIRIGMKIGKQGQDHHGFYIETGSHTAPAHPYLRPAVFDNAKEILNLLGK